MSYFGPGATPLFGLPLADVWFVVVFAFLATYLFLDGFDFGIGVLYAGRTDPDRAAYLDVIGPFWDGNEVWLVVFGGALFAAFPPLYAALFGRNYLLLFGVLFALALRGLAPEFRGEIDDGRWRQAWDAAFVVGSAAAPFGLGAFAANWALGIDGFGVPSLAFGVLAVLLCVAEGAAFLAVKTRGDRRAEARRLAVRGVASYLVWAVLSLAYLYAFVPASRATLVSVGGALTVLLTVVLGVAAAYTARAGRDTAAFAASGAMAYVLVALVALFCYPAVDPATGLGLHEAFVPPLMANLLSVAALILVPIIVFNLGVLYRVFSGPMGTGEGY